MQRNRSVDMGSGVSIAQDLDTSNPLRELHDDRLNRPIQDSLKATETNDWQ